MSGAVAMRYPTMDQRLGEGGVGAMNGGHPTRSTSSTGVYCLDVRQQPRQARMAGSGEKADRRTVDPPPVVRLRVLRPQARRKPRHTLTEADFVSPTLTHAHFCFASLVPENSEEELYDLAGSRSKYVGGNVVSSLFHTKDQSCFVFPDLSVRTEGRWRFKMSMFELVEDGAIFHDSVLTDVFTVYSSKRFPGMSKSTELSKSFAQQGLKLRIRRPEPNDKEDEAGQPNRKKSKPTTRQRPTAVLAAWSTTPDEVPPPPTPNPARRSSGPADCSHVVPLIAPIGSTTSTPQPQRPWTSWNASPSKIYPPRYPSSTISHGFPSQPPSSHSTIPRAASYDYRRLPQLDERNTAPDYARLPRMLDPNPVPSMHASFSTQQMPPPPPRHSPPNSSRPSFASSSSSYASSAPTQRPPTPPTILAPIRSDLHHPDVRESSAKRQDHGDVDRERRRTSNESPNRTQSEEGTTDATSVASSESGNRNEESEERRKLHAGVSISSGGGSLAMLLGEGARDAKEVEEVSFF